MSTRHALRRSGGVIVALVSALVLSACGAMPTSSSVQAVSLDQPVGGEEQIEVQASDPVKGSDPDRIVRDFIQAATSPRGDFATARKFLAPDATWQPNQSVTIDSFSDREVSEAAEDGAVTVTVKPVAVVDEEGVYRQAAPQPIVLPFQLELQPAGSPDAGEWRITSAPDGIVMESNLFYASYQSTSLMFFDPTFHYLVPDQRYFPKLAAPERTVAALLRGPSADIAPAVRTAIPDGTTLQDGSVVQADSTTTVSFTELSTDDSRTLGLMKLQLERSLGAASVTMTVGATALSPAPQTVDPGTVDSTLFALTPSGAVTVSGNSLTPSDLLADDIRETSPTALVLVSGTGTSTAPAVAVGRGQDGTVYRYTGGADRVVLDNRPGLIEPTVDPEGFVWTATADPSSLKVSSPQDQEITLETGITELTSVQAMQISRDGTRMAVLGTEGSSAILGWFPVLRGSDGKPTGLGEFKRLRDLGGIGLDVAWLDSLTIGVLSREGTDAWFGSDSIGGIRDGFRAPEGALHLSGVNRTANVRLLSSDGTLYSRRNSVFQKVADGISVLANVQTVIR